MKKGMLSKKTILFGGITIVVILMLVLLFFFIKSEIQMKNLTQAIQSAWEGTKTKDQPQYLSEIDKVASYQLKTIEQEDDKIVIIAEVSAPDLCTELSQFDFSDLPQRDDEGEINDFLCDQIKNAEIVKTEATIYAKKTDKGYDISFSEEFVDAMCGKLYSYSRELLMNMLQQAKEGE